MSNIRNRTTGVLLTEDEFRALNPSKILPAILTKNILNAENCDPVYNVAPPSIGFNEHTILDGAKLELNANGVPTGNWIQNWIVIPLTQAQLSTKTQVYIQEFELMVTEMVQRRLDEFAHTRGYGDRYGNNSVISCASYIGSSIPKYRTEAEYMVAKREETWNKVYEIKAKVLAQEIAMPNSYAEIADMLPVLQWPN